MLMEIKRLPAGTLLGFKTVPEVYCKLTEDPYPGQSESDWSAVYIQLGIEHAMAYLTN